jgi:hypothetical protein
MNRLLAIICFTTEPPLYDFKRRALVADNLPNLPRPFGKLGATAGDQPGRSLASAEHGASEQGSGQEIRRHLCSDRAPGQRWNIFAAAKPRGKIVRRYARTYNHGISFPLIQYWTHNFLDPRSKRKHSRTGENIIRSRRSQRERSSQGWNQSNVRRPTSVSRAGQKSKIVRSAKSAPDHRPSAGAVE